MSRALVTSNLFSSPTTRRFFFFMGLMMLQLDITDLGISSPIWSSIQPPQQQLQMRILYACILCRYASPNILFSVSIFKNTVET
jgi:hypothetical protein